MLRRWRWTSLPAHPAAWRRFISANRKAKTLFTWARFWAFALFITACGFTHVLSIVTLWVPIYGIEGLVKALTALASIFTAVILWPLLPRFLNARLPGLFFVWHQPRTAARGAKLPFTGMSTQGAKRACTRTRRRPPELGYWPQLAHDFDQIPSKPMPRMSRHDNVVLRAARRAGGLSPTSMTGPLSTRCAIEVRVVVGPAARAAE